MKTFLQLLKLKTSVSAFSTCGKQDQIVSTNLSVEEDLQVFIRGGFEVKVFVREIIEKF
jgi:hypothetical protein